MKLWVALLFVAFSTASASDPVIESVLLHPIFDRYYACAEHQDGQFKDLGDALGTDCFIMKSIDHNGRKWLRAYSGNGESNDEWFGWKQNVLSPIDGTVEKINLNQTINLPGVKGEGLASFIILKTSNGLGVMLAHIMSPTVKVGQPVKTGQIIAMVGNNGQSWHPHIHIGAWRNGVPLQIRFDQHNIVNK